MDLFDPVAFGPEPGSRPHREGELRRIWRWVRREHWTAQVVILTGAVAVAYIAAVTGLLVGAGVAP
jgi:hypothetical protein